MDAFHNQVLRAAESLLGVPYHFAGAGPGRCPTGEHTMCTDCSGLIYFAFATAGVRLPHSSARLATLGEPVPLEEVRPGDLLFFRSDGGSSGEVNHSGIYVGNGLFLHAGRRGVRLDELHGKPWGAPGQLRAVRRIWP